MPQSPENNVATLIPAFYTAAGQELAQRIQTRELVLVTYMAFSLALLGVASAKTVELVLALPVLAVACTLLSAHHDIVIGQLSDYMAELSDGVGTVRWHDRNGYLGKALNVRDLRDIASICYLMLTALASLIATYTKVQPLGPISKFSVAWWLGVICLITIPMVQSQVRCYRRKARVPNANNVQLIAHIGTTGNESSQPNKNQTELETDQITKIDDNLRAAYQATYTYHHMIVQARFATIALYLAAATLLLTTLITHKLESVPNWTYSLLGTALTILLYILDLRNRHLLDNCRNRGLKFEKVLKLPPDIAFFSLMNGPQNEPESGTLLGLRVSHSMVVNGLVVLLLVLWVAMAWIHI